MARSASFAPWPCPAIIVAAGAALAATGQPTMARAATATTVTLTISSTVDDRPGSCLLSRLNEMHSGKMQPEKGSFSVECSGTGPYRVAIEGASEIGVQLSADSGRSDPAARRAGVERYFTLPSTVSPIDSPDRSAGRAITAVVQY